MLLLPYSLTPPSSLPPSLPHPLTSPRGREMRGGGAGLGGVEGAGRGGVVVVPLTFQSCNLTSWVGLYSGSLRGYWVMSSRDELQLKPDETGPEVRFVLSRFTRDSQDKHTERDTQPVRVPGTCRCPDCGRNLENQRTLTQGEHENFTGTENLLVGTVLTTQLNDPKDPKGTELLLFGTRDPGTRQMQ
ncbi:unnamed protein product [Pleuronectes platessa]|uniref:Uncharacterized protein n=1 Tax=Pleuronectes platessa TaxID=8262 RepID=A0A9N7UNA4_PLEPL|nr:unnamed protein product [Pleuronectes platessa]